MYINDNKKIVPNWKRDHNAKFELENKHKFTIIPICYGRIDPKRRKASLSNIQICYYS